MLGEELVASGAIKHGKFILTSGKESQYYVDIKDSMSEPGLLGRTAKLIAERITSDIIAGVELGAVPLLVAVSILTGKRYIIIRKERSHGTKSLMVGHAEKGTSVDMIEDVITTGGSILRAVDILTESGLVVKKVICVVDREEGGKDAVESRGLKFEPIVRISEIKKSSQD